MQTLCQGGHSCATPAAIHMHALCASPTRQRTVRTEIRHTHVFRTAHEVTMQSNAEKSGHQQLQPVAFIPLTTPTLPRSSSSKHTLPACCGDASLPLYSTNNSHRQEPKRLAPHPPGATQQARCKQLLLPSGHTAQACTKRHAMGAPGKAQCCGARWAAGLNSWQYTAADCRGPQRRQHTPTGSRGAAAMQPFCWSLRARGRYRPRL